MTYPCETLSPAIRRLARAKLNLTLEIVGRRADGYHLLDSLVTFAAIGDEIAVSHADELALQIDGPFGSVLNNDGAENLVLRAARILAEHAGRALNASIRLTKNLPVASGIGGGSSDAAAALLALNELWELSMASDELQAIGLRLGADVPVCLLGQTARLEGIGERVSAAPALPYVPIVMINPGVGLATPKVFAARTGPFSPGAGPGGVLESSPATINALVSALQGHRNDLAGPAIQLLPVIGTVLETLQHASCCMLARMSGSGATCFGFFPTDAAARSGAADIQMSHPDWWVVATSIGEEAMVYPPHPTLSRQGRGL